jgi:hypothetical protein
LTPYFDDDLYLCGPCAQRLATDLDTEELWPPVELGPLTSIVPDDVPLRYDGVELERLHSLQRHYGARLHVERIGPSVMLSFTELVGDDAVLIAARHHGLLVSAWMAQGRRVIKLCDACRGPFLLPSSNASNCPVCAKGKRTLVVNIPFTVVPQQRRAS